MVVVEVGLNGIAIMFVRFRRCVSVAMFYMCDSIQAHRSFFNEGYPASFIAEESTYKQKCIKSSHVDALLTGPQRPDCCKRSRYGTALEGL